MPELVLVMMRPHPRSDAVREREIGNRREDAAGEHDADAPVVAEPLRRLPSHGDETARPGIFHDRVTSSITLGVASLASTVRSTSDRGSPLAPSGVASMLPEPAVGVTVAAAEGTTASDHAAVTADPWL